MKNSKGVQFSPQTGDYSVKVKNGSGWRDYRTCRLQISVGQLYHEGTKFEATAAWVEQRFEKVIVCVNDTLQRYNSLFLNPESETTAFKRWHEEGDLWIARNRDSLDRMPGLQIYRWDDWLSLPEFPEVMKKTEIFYATNRIFRDAIDENVQTFWQRNRYGFSMNGDDSFSRFFELSRSYLLEETAVFSIMFGKDMAVDIYPGSVLLPAILFRDNPMPGMPEGLDKGAFTRIDFKRNTPQPQMSPTPMATNTHGIA